MRRQLLWLILGLLALPLLLLVTAPELLSAGLPETAGLLGLVLAAGVPGLLLVVVIALRRRGRGTGPTTATDD